MYHLNSVGYSHLNCNSVINPACYDQFQRIVNADFLSGFFFYYWERDNVSKYSYLSEYHGYSF